MYGGSQIKTGTIKLCEAKLECFIGLTPADCKRMDSFVKGVNDIRHKDPDMSMGLHFKGRDNYSSSGSGVEDFHEVYFCGLQIVVKMLWPKDVPPFMSLVRNLDYLLLGIGHQGPLVIFEENSIGRGSPSERAVDVNEVFDLGEMTNPGLDVTVEVRVDDNPANAISEGAFIVDRDSVPGKGDEEYDDERPQ
ncbi:hypothetical protein GY45DRAFT_1340929 [Cubamyces sp. BRFM 1775]|nr:hypothetical protein GY45DRAFT_1340929 [Cubamyces sp. BRFM 1775]